MGAFYWLAPDHLLSFYLPGIKLSKQIIISAHKIFFGKIYFTMHLGSIKYRECKASFKSLSLLSCLPAKKESKLRSTPIFLNFISFLYFLIFLFVTTEWNKLHRIFFFFLLFFSFLNIRRKNKGSITPFPCFSLPVCLPYSNSYSSGQFQCE